MKSCSSSVASLEKNPSEEQERETKQRANNKNGCVAAVETNEVVNDLQPLVEAVTLMEAQIKGLTQHVNSMPGPSGANQQRD